MDINDYHVLEGFYDLDKTIGRGGFAKVKKATHKLTGERVAIKILDKKSLGEDLPRVYREIDTLKTLCHVHICKLYQVIYTENKIFMIMEYCRGGELFDYIVERDRLDEVEGKRIFRQIASAVKYIHQRGISHRDLKPENILLDENNNVKLIDFGLCAAPVGGIKSELETCCGSPAYASPELVKGEKYIGPQTDPNVWSLGVLLYALLNGYLPFDDANLGQLYRKIQAGIYDEPRWLTEGSKNILRCMLQVKPEMRLTVEELLNHTWCKSPSDLNRMSPMADWNDKVDTDAIAKMAGYYGRSIHSMEAAISRWDYLSYDSACYFLLVERKKRHGTRVLRDYPMNPYSATQVFNPRIQRSLDSELMECEGDEQNRPPSTPKPPPRRSSNNHHHSSMEGGLDDAHLLTICSPKSGENEKEEFIKPRVINQQTPKRPRIPQATLPTPTPLSMGMKNCQSPSSRSADSIINSMQTPLKERIRGFGYSPMPSSPKNKVFGSIERGLDRVRNILTPKKKNKLKTLPREELKSMTVSATVSDDPDSVLTQLKSSLSEIGVQCKQKGYRLIGERGRLKIELQIIKIANSNLVGVQRKRICGEAIEYKRVIEHVINLTNSGLSTAVLPPPQNPPLSFPTTPLQTMV